MTIAEMHILFKLSLDKIGSNQLPYFEPEAIDVILNYAIKAVMKQKISGNNILKQSAEETTKRKLDLQTMIVNYTCEASSFVSNSNNKPYGVFVPIPTSPKMFYLLDEEVCISSDTCSQEIVSGKIEEGIMYKVKAGPVTYKTVSYAVGKVFMGIKGYTTYTGGTVILAKRINALPIRNDQYNSLILDPFNKPDKNKVLKLEYGVISSATYIELISSKGIDINAYYLRYYKNPAKVQLGTQYPTTGLDIDCDLPELIHEEIVDFAVNWTLESIESPRLQTNLLNIQRNE